MEQKVLQAILGILVALMAWNFKTVNEIQLQMETVMYKYANLDDINDMKLSIKQLEWRMMEDSLEK
jgi:hypothetical protein